MRCGPHLIASAVLIATAGLPLAAEGDRAQRQQVLDAYGLGPSQLGAQTAIVPDEVIAGEPPPEVDGTDPPPPPWRWRLTYQRLPTEGHQVVRILDRSTSSDLEFDSHWRMRLVAIPWDAREGFDWGLGATYTRASIDNAELAGYGATLEPFYVVRLGRLHPALDALRLEGGLPLGLGYDVWTMSLSGKEYGYHYSLGVAARLAYRWAAWEAFIEAGYERSYHPFQFDADQADVDSSVRMQGTMWGLGVGRSF